MARLDFKKIIPHLIAGAILLLVNVLYFYPQLEGKRIAAGDALASTAWSAEVTEFSEKTGKDYYWNNGIFSGMPWSLLYVGRQDNFVGVVDQIMKAGLGNPISFFFKASLICYLALILLGIGPWISLIGAIAFAINVNFIVLIEAGHQAKVEVISNFPLIVSGLILCFRNKPILGAGSIALATSLAIYGNHIQMVYYLLLTLVVMAISYLIYAIRDKKLDSFIKASAIALGAALLGAASNYTQLSSSSNFSDDTMRGKPILAKSASAEATSSSQVEGLEWNYAMQWSNGFTDLISILIPRVVGGSSAEEIDANTSMGQLMRNNGAARKSDGSVKAPLYWGGLPFTSGPYYLGAAILLLFTLSMFVLEARLRYGILGAFVLVCLLSMGSNFSILNKTLFNYLPLFNKFRSPNSGVNLLPVFVVLPAMIGLQKILKSSDKAVLVKRLWQSTLIVGGVCLIFALFGDTFLSYTNAAEERYPANVREIFAETRSSLMRSDAMRSIAVLLVSAGLLWLYLKQKVKSEIILLAGLGLVVTLDHWTVDRRYLDKDSFESKDDYMKNLAARQVDQQIKQMEPKGRGYYRVLDLSINTFNSASTSFHHNTIGGYHPAKLQRYQDIIDYYISKGDPEVLNMLNTKYIITEEQKLQLNAEAYGNAWFVNDVVFANTPNEEIEKLGTIETRNQAVILQNEFAEQLEGFKPGSGVGSIELTDYEPTHLVYSVSTEQDQLAVFSEIWYGPDKGWEVTIDGQPAEMIRANYLLRALRIPSGQHEVIFTFEPKRSGAVFTNLSSILLLLGLITGGVFLYRTSDGQTVPADEESRTVKTTAERRPKTKSKIVRKTKTSPRKK